MSGQELTREGTVGFVGLGIMGSAMMRNAAAAGFRVFTYDIADHTAETTRAAGGTCGSSPRNVAEQSSVVVTSLATAAAFQDVFRGENGLCCTANNKPVVVDTSTLPLATKCHARDALAALGMQMLDCPVSGTGSQAARKQISIFVSGDAAAAEMCRPVLESFTQSQHYLGEFGNGIKMKFLANYLVNIHGAAAAEVMTLGVKAGLPARLIYDTLRDSAATSRIFEVRGPLMLGGHYDPPTARIEMFLKDLAIIGDFAETLRCPSVLFSAAKQYYVAAGANGLGAVDVAAVYEIFKTMAGIAPSEEPDKI